MASISCACCSNPSDSKREPFIDTTALAKRCRLDNGRTDFQIPMIGPDTAGWDGRGLQGLPIELYQSCLQHLDIQTLTDMRRVSQFTRFTIDSLYQYKEIFDYGPQALRACLSTGVAPRIPLLRLHNSLTSMECHYCKISDPPQTTFGTHLSLYSCHRSCAFCLRNSPLLKPLELKTLISLSLARNCSIRSLSSIPFLKTIPGHYSPLHTPLITRTSLFASSSITSLSSATTTLTEKERRVLLGNERSAIINHHPFLTPSAESDISPSADSYHSPESTKEISYRYTTALLFPYLPSSKNLLDHGTPCPDCTLHMQFSEDRWTKEQENRRRNFQDATASLRGREYINGTRKAASMMYSVSDEASRDGDGRGMSIQEHRLLHTGEILSAAEIKFRAKTKDNGNSSVAV